MDESHSYCAGVEDGKTLKRELKKTSVKILAVLHSRKESGRDREMENTVRDWQLHFTKICNLVWGQKCQDDEAKCKKSLDRIVTMLILLRREIDLCDE